MVVSPLVASITWQRQHCFLWAADGVIAVFTHGGVVLLAFHAVDVADVFAVAIVVLVVVAIVPGELLFWFMLFIFFFLLRLLLHVVVCEGKVFLVLMKAVAKFRRRTKQQSISIWQSLLPLIPAFAKTHSYSNQHLQQRVLLLTVTNKKGTPFLQRPVAADLADVIRSSMPEGEQQDD